GGTGGAGGAGLARRAARPSIPGPLPHGGILPDGGVMGGQARRSRPPGAVTAGRAAGRAVGGGDGIRAPRSLAGQGGVGARRSPAGQGGVVGRRGPIGRGAIGRRVTTGPTGRLDRKPDLESGPLRRAARAYLPAM